MYKKLCIILLCCAFILSGMKSTAYADIGPKPSVVIDFIGLEDERYYVTLLSEEASTGPHSVLGETHVNQKYHEGDEDFDIWKKFVDYKDKDGFYFLQYFFDCTDTSQFTWGYFPPNKFKVLLYFPEQDSFAVSDEVYERYAFDSYYTVDVKGLEIKEVKSLEAYRNYNYINELISLIVRIIATIAIEIIIAIPFGFRSKKQLIIIGAVNLVTQTILNILLNIINYNQGSSMFVLHYVWMEVLVVILEAIAYAIFLNKDCNAKDFVERSTTLYAITANTASFIVGLCIAQIIPGIF